MNLIICIDNNGGMLFNNRRLSQDREIIKDILDTIGTNKLYINNFSVELFKNYSSGYSIEKNLFDVKYKENDYCFLENVNPKQILDKVSKIIVYKWNREYPADTFFNINMQKWKIEKEAEIKGYSHEVINKCEYIRRDK